MSEYDEDIDKIEGSFEALCKAVKANKFDFIIERDIADFLYSELKDKFSDRVPIKLESGEVKKTYRLHTEVKFKEEGKEAKKFDIVVLGKGNNPYEVMYRESGEKITGLKPSPESPFFAGIEIKRFDTKNYRSKISGKIKEDIEKLKDCDIDNRYIVLVNFNSDLKIEDELLKKIKNTLLQENENAVIKLFYIGIDQCYFL